MQPVPLEQAREAKAKAREAFARLCRVAAVGIAPMEGGYGLKVDLTDEPGPGIVLPDHVDGVPVRVEVVGRIRKR